MNIGASDDYIAVNGKAVNNEGMANVMQSGNEMNLSRKSKREIDSNIIGSSGTFNFIKKMTGFLFGSDTKDDAKKFLIENKIDYDKTKVK